MAYQHVNAEAWDTFEKRFPDARAFLLQHEWIGERRDLTAEAKRLAAQRVLSANDIMRYEWIKGRLAFMARTDATFGAES